MTDLRNLIRIAEERDDDQLRKLIASMQLTDELLRQISKPWWQRLLTKRTRQMGTG